MKKYLILAAAAALTLASCAKVENYATSTNDGRQVIGFSNYAPKSLTRADADNYASSTSLVSDAEFDVWAWYTANGTPFDGTNGTKYFSNWYTVIYKGGDNTTDGSANTYPDGARYWPAGDTPDYLHFYAYYPSNAAGITAPSAGLGAFTFTAQATAAAQVDFMVADIVTDQVYGATNSAISAPGTVDLTFRHQLTKVQVKFKTTAAIVADANTDIVVTDAKFVNINNTGTLTSSYDGTIFDTAWSSVSGTATYDIAYPTSALTATASDVANDDIFLLVPQTMLANTDPSAQAITVSWTITTAGVATNCSKTIYLDDCVSTDGGSTAADIDWEKNNSVIYVITIAPNQILFTGTAAGWDADVTGYYNING